MSYAEQKWTVDKIGKSNLGKDLYIAGIPRGGAIRKVVDCNRNYTNLVDVHGSGALISAVASCRRTNFYKESTGSISMLIDNSRKIELNTLAKASTSGSGDYNSSISTDVNQLFSDILIDSGDLRNPNVTLNRPILFKERFQIVSTSTSEMFPKFLRGGVLHELD